jgi:glucokinase
VGYWTRGNPQATEGGHGVVFCDPDDPVESHIWRELYRLNPAALPVYDDVVCGPGLATLAKLLSNITTTTSYPKVDLSAISDKELPELLSRWANDADFPPEKRDFARVVFRYFGTFLGRALQLPVLATLPDTLFLSGPIIQTNYPHFRGQFLQAITSHRYHEQWLKSLPIAVVNHPELNLDGAVEAAKRMITD